MEYPVVPGIESAPGTRPKGGKKGFKRKGGGRPSLPFKERRARLLKSIYLELMSGDGSFTDTKIACYSRRSLSGVPYDLRELAVNTKFLQEVSDEFTTLFHAPHRVTPHYNEDNDEDSDLEWDEEACKAPDITPCTATPVLSPSNTPAKGESCLSSVFEAEMDSEAEDLMEELLAQENEKGVIVDESREVNQCHPDYEERPSTQASTAIVVRGAHKTWKAINLYYLTDDITFNSLRSQECATNDMPVNPIAGSLPCPSPKSIYRRAMQFQLPDLKELAVKAIKGSLSPKNIIAELFSDFTWRYPDILVMETDVYYEHRSDAKVVDDLNGVYELLKRQHTPRHLVVLHSIHTKLLHMTQDPPIPAVVGAAMAFPGMSLAPWGSSAAPQRWA